MTTIHYRKANVDGMKVFYREAGPVDAPILLLLHGFPSAGHMFRELIPALADRFRVVAPDLPGFGQSDMPSRDKFTYTFARLAEVIERFTEVIGLGRSQSTSSTTVRRPAFGWRFAIPNASAPSFPRTATPTKKG